MSIRDGQASRLTGVAFRAAYCLICIYVCGRLSAQTIPVVNPPSVVPGKPLEMERVEVGRLMAMPGAINRPVGAFVLVLVNRTGDSNAAFALRSASLVTGQTASAPLLVFDSHTPEVGHRKAGYLDLPPGKYSLQDAAGTRVLCTITIE